MNAEERLRRNIRRLVHEKGTKLSRLAEVADRTASWASMYLKGARPFPFEQLDAVGQLFGVTADQLLGEVEKEPAASASARRPGLDVDAVAITPESDEPEITFSLRGPPEFIVDRVERAPWNIPLVDDTKYIGRTVRSFWSPEQMAALFPLLQKAWDGTTEQVAYFMFTTKDGRVVYRRAVWRRQGDCLLHHVYRLPDTTIPMHAVAMNAVVVPSRVDGMTTDPDT